MANRGMTSTGLPPQRDHSVLLAKLRRVYAAERAEQA